MNDLSVYTLRLFDGTYPARVAAITLRSNRYEAEEVFREWLLEVKGVDLDDTDLEVAEAMEDDEFVELYKV